MPTGSGRISSNSGCCAAQLDLIIHDIRRKIERQLASEQAAAVPAQVTSEILSQQQRQRG